MGAVLSFELARTVASRSAGESSSRASGGATVSAKSAMMSAGRRGPSVRLVADKCKHPHSNAFSGMAQCRRWEQSGHKHRNGAHGARRLAKKKSTEKKASTGLGGDQFSCQATQAKFERLPPLASRMGTRPRRLLSVNRGCCDNCSVAQQLVIGERARAQRPPRLHGRHVTHHDGNCASPSGAKRRCQQRQHGWE